MSGKLQIGAQISAGGYAARGVHRACAYACSRPLASGLRLRLALRLSALCVTLCLSSGCWFTLGMWEWADQAPASRELGVKTNAQGEDLIVYHYNRSCPGFGPGYHGLVVPANWREQGRVAGQSNQQELGLKQPLGTRQINRAEWYGLRSRRHRLVRLRPQHVMGESPQPPGTSSYGVMHSRGPGQFLDIFYGYDPGSRRWIRLGELQVFPYHGGRHFFAAAMLPITLTVDIVLLAAWIGIQGSAHH